MRWRRFRMWSGQFLMCAPWFRTCSARLPVRSSCSRNCPPTFIPSLLGIAGAQPVVGGVGGGHHRGLSAAARASVASRLPLGLPLAGILGPPLAGASGLPVTGEATGVAPLDVIALGRASAVSGMAPVAADAAFPIAAGSSFRHVFGGLLLPVSLWALAAGALPGAGGLVILTAAGVRVGYRQAKPVSSCRPRASHASPVRGR